MESVDGLDVATETVEASQNVAMRLVQLLSSLLLYLVALISYRSRLSSYYIFVFCYMLIFLLCTVPRFTLQVLSWTGVITLEFNLVKVLLCLGVLTSVLSLWIKVSFTFSPSLKS